MEALSSMNLPPGFGFHPTDVELISHYLKNKMLGQGGECEIIPEVDIYKHEPWELPAKCKVPTRDSKWHFFTSRDRKYPNSSRSNRATEAGYWKSTGKDRKIRVKDKIIGTKKTLVFHQGRPPSGKRSDWIMHEYYIDEKDYASGPDVKDVFVLCRVTKRNEGTSESENCNREDISPPHQPSDINGSDISAEIELPPLNEEELNQWLQELLAPAPGLEIPNLDVENTETLGRPALVSPKLEPEDSCPDQKVADDNIDYLLTEDIYNILYPGTDDFSNGILTDQLQDPALEVPAAAFHFQGYNVPNADQFASSSNFGGNIHLEEQHVWPTDNDLNDAIGDVNDNGIIIRQQPTGNSKTVLTGSQTVYGRVLLNKAGLNKMVTSNFESINETVKFEDNSGRLGMVANVEHDKGPKDEVSSTASSGSYRFIGKTRKQSGASNANNFCDGALSPKKTPEVKGSGRSSGKLKLHSNIQGFMRGCSSAGVNFLFVGAFMVATVAVLYFLLRDGRRFSGSSYLGI